MSTLNIESLLENCTIQPSLEMGAFEALWATKKVSSFKQLSTLLSDSKHNKMSQMIKKENAIYFYDRAIERLGKSGIKQFGIVLDKTIDYPVSLKDADYPLCLIYYSGFWDLAFSNGVAVVGTKNPSEDGVTKAIKLVKTLVKEGLTIFSGLAAGIDAVAHKTAIEAGGLTVAVIGTPLWMRYPKENAELYKEISKNHLLISQVPIICYEQNHVQANRFFFPERNKTMASLSKATIIVEAGGTSGTLIQARSALKQGRKVFILNDNFEKRGLSLPSKFEQTGAIRVRSLKDILNNL